MYFCAAIVCTFILPQTGITLLSLSKIIVSSFKLASLRFSFLNTVADNKRITIKTMTDKNNLLFLNFFTLPRQLPYFPLLNRFNMIALSRLWIMDQEIKELTCDYSIGRSAKWQIVRFHNIAGVCS